MEIVIKERLKRGSIVMERLQVRKNLSAWVIRAKKFPWEKKKKKKISRPFMA